jgi:hypothetical protein
MLCSICFNDIPSVNGWDSGNNAEPVNYGRCCDTCNNNVVIPARINMMMRKPSHAALIDMRREQFRIMSHIMMAAESELELKPATQRQS